MLDKLCASYTDPGLAKVYDPLNCYADSEARSFFISLAGTEPRCILDVGCGTGILACELSKLGHRVTGIDPAEAML
jgi:ubiquinone/menaquinone biosynthesis C-methylase UbiE